MVHQLILTQSTPNAIEAPCQPFIVLGSKSPYPDYVFHSTLLVACRDHLLVFVFPGRRSLDFAVARRRRRRGSGREGRLVGMDGRKTLCGKSSSEKRIWVEIAYRVTKS